MQEAATKLTVVLARHAEREFIANLSDREQPITGKGQRSAHVLGEKLQNQLGQIAVPVIFSSPLLRCMQTANILAAYLEPKAGVRSVPALTVTTDEAAREAVRWTLNLLASNLEAGCLVFVGHQPEMLAIGLSLSQTTLPLKTGEAVGLELEAKAGLWQVGSAKISWRIKG